MEERVAKASIISYILRGLDQKTDLGLRGGDLHIKGNLDQIYKTEEGKERKSRVERKG